VRSAQRKTDLGIRQEASVSRYFRPQELIDFALRLLVAKGVPEDNARHVAEVVVTAESMGVTTHGITVLNYFNAQIPQELDPKAEPTIVKERGATALIEGNSCFGQLAMRLAAQTALDKVRSHGAAVVGVRNCLWIAALSTYLLPIARAGFLAQLWAQTSTCKDAAPVGGIEAKFSTNPVAIAIPTPEEPILADFATTCYSMGSVTRMARGGAKAPEPVFLDAGGTLSSDPRVVLEGGSILFIGGEHFGHKGYGLSLWAEALAALVGGSSNNPDTKTRQNVTLLLLDPEAFEGAAYYQREMTRFLRHLRNSRPRPGYDEIRLPGQRSLRLLKAADTRGVPLTEEMIAALNETARRNHVPGL
jgi:LDH2 family malate/lactate/ureidoglycolate dehydrogenase